MFLPLQGPTSLSSLAALSASAFGVLFWAAVNAMYHVKGCEGTSTILLAAKLQSCNGENTKYGLQAKIPNNTSTGQDISAHYLLMYLQ